MSPILILVVGDDGAVVRPVTRKLKQSRIHCDAATTAAEALDLSVVTVTGW